MDEPKDESINEPKEDPDKYTQYMKFVRERIALLMTQKGVSAANMSRELGYSRIYLSEIFSGKKSPSLKALFKIMEYLEIEPQNFFDLNLSYPAVTLELCEEFRKLDIKDQECYLEIFKRQIRMAEELNETKEALKKEQEKNS